MALPSQYVLWRKGSTPICTSQEEKLRKKRTSKIGKEKWKLITMFLQEWSDLKLRPLDFVIQTDLLVYIKEMSQKMSDLNNQRGNLEAKRP